MLIVIAVFLIAALVTLVPAIVVAVDCYDSYMSEFDHKRKMAERADSARQDAFVNRLING